MLSLSLNHLPRPKPVSVLRGHSQIVWSVVFLQSGNKLASASNDGSIRLWNLDHASEVILGNSCGSVFCLAMFPDGKRLASGGLDRSVNVWDVDVLAAVDEPWKAHASSVRYLDISSNCRYLASGSFDHKVNFWDTRSGKLVGDQTHLIGDRKINCVKFSNKGCKLLTGSGDGCLRVWEWVSGNLLVGPIRGDETPIWAVAWSRDDAQILSGDGEGVLRRWQASTGCGVGEPVNAHDKSIVYSLSVSQNGYWVASASSDNTVKIWNATTLEPIAVLEHPNEVNCIAFSTDDRYIATACSDSAIYIWEAPQTSLDSGLVIDNSEGASLLEPPAMAIPFEVDAVEDGRSSQRNSGTLEKILNQSQSHTPPFSRKNTEPAESQAKDVVISVESKGLLGRLFGRPECREGRVNVREPTQQRRTLPQKIKMAIAKSRKFLFNLW